jgi:glycolate oxidase
MNQSLHELADIFKEICGQQNVLSEPADLAPYGKDETLDLCYPFDLLVKPSSPQDISRILRACSSYGIPVTPRGGGSGVTGGALPAGRGVVLSLERLNKIITIDAVDGYVMAESGVVTAHLCHAVKEAGCYFPVEPTSSGSSFIGGNVASNAGSVKSCKYGKTGEYVLNLEVVLPSGEIIWTGSNLRKNSTGPNLTQLFVGSEGMLGIVTKVVYRLLPPPPEEILVLAAFRDPADACHAVMEIKRSALFPSEVELIGQQALNLTAGFLGEAMPLVNEDISTHLLICLDKRPGNDESLDLAFHILEKYAGDNILVADTQSGKERLRKIRLHIGAAMTGYNRKYRDIDVCIPLSFLHRYMQKVEEIAGEEKLTIACFGHALDGNLHTMAVVDRSDEQGERKIHKAARRIYEYATGIGGVISGEHGIGLLQKEYLLLQYTGGQLQLLNDLKRLFDPKGILNPGKSFTAGQSKMENSVTPGVRVFSENRNP